MKKRRRLLDAGDPIRQKAKKHARLEGIEGKNG
jgi:hypothetical protein